MIMRPYGVRREHLARILHNANTGLITPDSSDPTLYMAMAAAVIEEWSEERTIEPEETAIHEYVENVV